MGLNYTQKIYQKIFKEVIQEVKDDPILQTKLDPQDLLILESEWNKNLKDSGIFSSYVHEMSMMQNQAMYNQPGFQSNRN